MDFLLLNSIIKEKCKEKLRWANLVPRDKKTKSDSLPWWMFFIFSARVGVGA